MSIFSTSTSAFFDRSTLDLTSLRARAEDLQSQISSGNRLTSSSDDPVAASRLRALQRTDKLATVDVAAANRATSDLNLADSAMTEFSSFITRAQELATQAANGTLTADQRAGIGTELAQIHGNLLALANTRDSAGHALFGGDTAGDAYQIDATTGYAKYVGTGTAGELALGDGQKVSRTMTGPEFLNANGTDLMKVIKDLGDQLTAGGTGAAAAAKAALDPLNTSLQSVTTAQTIIGSRLNWIDLTTQRQLAMGEQRASEQTDIGSTDVTSAITQLQELTVVLQASQASFSKLANLSLFSVIN
jgi:flagellar hook-associated protein 3 FlgL